MPARAARVNLAEVARASRRVSKSSLRNALRDGEKSFARYMKIPLAQAGVMLINLIKS
jgi:hypothetical protein